MLMLNVLENGTIELTRGDTARLEVDITLKDIEGNEIPYQIDSTDTLTFTVKKCVKDFKPCFQKKVTGGNVFHIKPCDTKHLPFGKYVYDVELVTSKGDTYTVIEKNIFKVCDEVT